MVRALAIAKWRREAMKNDSTRRVLEIVKTLALVAIATILFCALYLIYPMIPIYD